MTLETGIVCNQKIQTPNGTTSKLSDHLRGHGLFPTKTVGNISTQNNSIF